MGRAIVDHGGVERNGEMVGDGSVGDAADGGGQERGAQWGEWNCAARLLAVRGGTRRRSWDTERKQWIWYRYGQAKVHWAREG